MITLNVTAGTTTTNTPIGLSLGMNTNNKLELSNNSVVFKTPGIFEITGEVSLTNSSATATGISIYANGTAYGNQITYTAGSTTDNVIIPIYSVIEIDSSIINNYATVNFIPVGTPTIVNGLISIKEIV